MSPICIAGLARNGAGRPLSQTSNHAAGVRPRKISAKTGASMLLPLHITAARLPEQHSRSRMRPAIATLRADGRLSNADLAHRVGLSPSPCLRRVNRLEREGYIEGYRAMLRRKPIGLGLTVFVGVKIDGHADDRATAFEEAVCALREASDRPMRP